MSLYLSISSNNTGHTVNFIAVRLRVNLETYFGWIDIDGAINPVVKEYAINLINEKSIRAGQKK